MDKTPYTDEIVAFLENVAYLRKVHGLSKKAMADILNIGIASLNTIERGELPPQLGVDVLFRIQAAFDISASALFERYNK